MDDELEQRFAHIDDRPQGETGDFTADETLTELALQLADVRDVIGERGLAGARSEAARRADTRGSGHRYAGLEHRANLLLSWLLRRADGADEEERLARAAAALANPREGLGAELHAVAGAWADGTLSDTQFSKLLDRPRGRLPAKLAKATGVTPAPAPKQVTRPATPGGRSPQVLAADLSAVANEGPAPEAFWKAYRAWATLPAAPPRSGLTIDEELFLFEWGDEEGRLVVWFVRQWGYHDGEGYAGMQQLRAETTIDWPEGWEVSSDGLWSGEDLEEWFAEVEASDGMEAFLSAVPAPRLTVELEWI